MIVIIKRTVGSHRCWPAMAKNAERTFLDPCLSSSQIHLHWMDGARAQRSISRPRDVRRGQCPPCHLFCRMKHFFFFFNSPLIWLTSWYYVCFKGIPRRRERKEKKFRSDTTTIVIFVKLNIMQMLKRMSTRQRLIKDLEKERNIWISSLACLQFKKKKEKRKKLIHKLKLKMAAAQYEIFQILTYQ